MLLLKTELLQKYINNRKKKKGREKWEMIEKPDHKGYNVEPTGYGF